MATTTGESGIGLVELFLGSTAIAVAVLGTVGGLMTSLKVAIDSKDTSLAEQDAAALITAVHDAARTDFEGALSDYRRRQLEGSGNRLVHTRIILDETCFDPPVDLNDDGDCDDTGLGPAEVDAAFLETKVTWGRNKSITDVSLLRRAAGSRKHRIRRARAAAPGR